MGRTAPESGNHKKSAVDRKCRKTFAGVKELTQNFVPLYYLPGEIGWKTSLKHLNNTKQKGFFLKFLAGVRQGHIKPWIYICKDPIISGL